MMLVSCRKGRAALVCTAALLSLSYPCFASPVALSALDAVATVAPGSPALATLNDGAAAPEAKPVSPGLQTVDHAPGDWSVSGQLTGFSFQDGVTPMATTELLDIFAQPDDTVASGAGLLLADRHRASASEALALDPAASGDVNPGAIASVELSREGSGAGGRLFLLATATLGICMLAAVASRSRSEEEPPPPPVRGPIAGRAWVQRGTTFSMPAQEQPRANPGRPRADTERTLAW